MVMGHGHGSWGISWLAVCHSSFLLNRIRGHVVLVHMMSALGGGDGDGGPQKED